jgi:hypothetical protein
MAISRRLKHYHYCYDGGYDKQEEKENADLQFVSVNLFL